MNVSIDSKKDSHYNYYLKETKGGKMYYKAVLKKEFYKKKDLKKLTWPILFLLSIPLMIIALNISSENTTVEAIQIQEERIEEVNEVEETSEVTKEYIYEGVCSEWYDLVSQYDWNVEEALAIMRAESSCNPYSFNDTLNYDGSWDAGLFQVNSIHGKDKDWLMIPENNVQEAYNIYLRAGRSWTPWSVYNNGRYLQFLSK